MPEGVGRGGLWIPTFSNSKHLVPFLHGNIILHFQSLRPVFEILHFVSLFQHLELQFLHVRAAAGQGTGAAVVFSEILDLFWLGNQFLRNPECLAPLLCGTSVNLEKNKTRKNGSSLVTGHVPTHPFPEARPDTNPTLTQTLDLTQGRVGTWPTTEQGPEKLYLPPFLFSALPAPAFRLKSPVEDKCDPFSKPTKFECVTFFFFNWAFILVLRGQHSFPPRWAQSAGRSSLRTRLAPAIAAKRVQRKPTRPFTSQPLSDVFTLTLPLPSSKSTFSKPFKDKCINEVVRIL